MRLGLRFRGIESEGFEDIRRLTVLHHKMDGRKQGTHIAGSRWMEEIGAVCDTGG